MSATQEFERRIADHYMAEAPPKAPDWVLEQILASVDATPQRRTALRRPWRIPSRPSTFAKLGTTAVAIAAVGLGGLTLMWGPVMGPTPSPSPSPSPSVSVEPRISGGMWPQTSLEEVRQAQELADAGDPRYTWQVDMDLGDPGHLGQHHPHDAQIFTRFLDEVLGWEAFRDGHHVPRRDEASLGEGDVVYIRCAPDGTNPMYSTDPDGASCAPTLDELRYETVKINVARLDRQGWSGIWVVTGWEMIGPAEQVAPPSDAEIAASLGAFLQARIDGEGAEGFVDVSEPHPLAAERVDREVPLLYTSSSGAPYERSEFEVMDGPTWPKGGMQFKVRLFAEDGKSVVEQVFWLDRDETGHLRVLYDYQPTTENGKHVPVEYSFLDGEVTYRAAYPLGPSQDEFRNRDRLAIDGLLPDDDAPRRVLLLLADPRLIGPGCVEGPAPADAEELAQGLLSDPDLEATAPVAVTIGGIPARRIDVVLAPGASFCSWLEPETSWTSPLFRNAPFHVGADRARLYLLDLREGSEARVLALVTITDEDSFETVLRFAAPIVESIEFHGP